MRVRIKICGITTVEDALAAVDAGADALGFVFHQPSPRYIEPDRARRIIAALPPFVTPVGLVVNRSPEAVASLVAASGVVAVQFHGDETPVECRQAPLAWFKALRVRPETDVVSLARQYMGARAILLDAWDGQRYGGSGRTFDWTSVEDGLPVPLVLAGGLTPTNVGEAIATLKPYAVDVSSGVEAEPGRKDHDKMRRFAAEVKKFERKA